MGIEVRNASIKYILQKNWSQITLWFSFCVVNPLKEKGKNTKLIGYRISCLSHKLWSSFQMSPWRRIWIRGTSKTPFFTWEDFNALITDLNLTKSKAELLASRWNQWNLLIDVKITDESRHKTLATLFTREDGLLIVTIYEVCLKQLRCPYSQWVTCIYWQVEVLVQNGNEFPSIPVA